jgi:hypothetical protein
MEGQQASMGPAEVELQNHATGRHDLPANSLRGVENTKEASLLCPGRIRTGTGPQGHYYFEILDTAHMERLLSAVVANVDPDRTFSLSQP